MDAAVSLRKQRVELKVSEEEEEEINENPKKKWNQGLLTSEKHPGASGIFLA